MKRILSNRMLFGIGIGIFLVATFITILYSRTENTYHHDILVVLKTLNNPYYIDMKRGVDQAAATLPKNKYQVDVKAYDTEDDLEGQVTTIRSYLQRGQLAAVSLAPVSSTDLAPVVSQLNKENIPVIILDTRMSDSALKQHNASIQAFIGSDNEAGGQLAAKFIGEKIGNRVANVLFLEGVPTQETAQSRKRGFMDVAKTQYQNWQIIQRTAEWNREKAKAVTEAILATVGVPAAIFGSNDEMALGAVTALRDHGIAHDQWPVIVGFDATTDALDNIAHDGGMSATIKQQPDETGRAAVKWAVDLIEGNMVPKEKDPGSCNS